MKVRGLGRLRRATRWFGRAFMPCALILLYHRVTTLPSDPQLLGVTPGHFAEHLEVLKKYGSLLRLQELVQALQDRRLPRRAVIITFDDGYADNLYEAKPLLERYDVPASVFVATGVLGRDREFWWDELERLLLRPAPLRRTLHLKINGRSYQWELVDADGHARNGAESIQGWNVLAPTDSNPGQFVYRSLCQLLRPLPEGERQAVLQQLAEWSGETMQGRPTHRTLSAEELIRLSDGALVDVGAHTVTHSVLSVLPAAEQRSEIQRSKTHLEEILGRPVKSFAYPYGSPSDYTEETTALVREAGFSSACSNFAEVVGRGTDPYQLPRIVVRDWSGETLARRLTAWFAGSVE